MLNLNLLSPLMSTFMIESAILNGLGIKHLKTFKTCSNLKGLSHQFEWVGKKKTRRKLCQGFLLFSIAPLTFNKHKQKFGTSEERNLNCQVFSDSCWTTLPGLLLDDGLISWIFHHTQPKGTFSQLIYCFICICFICPFPSGFSVPFKKCPEAVQ